MTLWLTCLCGPLAGRDLLPGDDPPDGGQVRLRGVRGGVYKRAGGHLVWVADRDGKAKAVRFYKAMTRKERTA